MSADRRQARDVPYRPQETAGACGPAAARMALERAGIRRDEAELIERSPLRAQGTTPWALRRLVREQGADADLRFRAGIGDLEAALDDGGTPIVAVRARDLADPGGESRSGRLTNHFVVVTGLERRDGAVSGVVFHDPRAGPDRRLTPERFERAWTRWGGSHLGLPRPLITVRAQRPGAAAGRGGP